MLLPPLFHWTASSRRISIEREGLLPFSPSIVNVAIPDRDDPTVLSWPWVCLAPDPARAWQLSGGMGWDVEDPAWDLWQVTLADGDEVRVQSEFGPRIKEVRVLTAIPASRCWYVASRAPLIARESPKVS